MNFSLYRLLLLIVMPILMVGCSSKPTDQASEVYDPLEGVNRTMWTLNYDYIDPYVLRPTAIAYVSYVPTPVRHGLSNFFSNLGEPASVLNNLLMGNGHKAATHFNRFWLNSTFGLLGIMDIASEVGLTEDDSKGLDDTLGHYGVGDGAYLMVPAAGPYTVRNIAGFVDSNYFPMTYLNVWGSLGKFLVQGLEARAALVNQESILENSPDPYAFTRDIYLQRQAYKAEIVTEQFDQIEEETFDDYLDEYSYEE